MCCNQIGDYGHTAAQVRQFVKLFKLVIKDEIGRVMLPASVGVSNIVFVGGTMDGATFSSKKYDVCVVLFTPASQTKALPIGLQEFEYNDENKKVKNTKASVQAFKEAMREWGLLPTDPTPSMLLDTDPVVVLRNFALDGVYIHEKMIIINQLLTIIF